jgi:uracil-DNA glycosylase family 4
MNGFSARDAVFLNEMGLGPLWQLRAAPVAEVEAGVEEKVEAAPADVPAVVAPASAPVSAPVSGPLSAPISAQMRAASPAPEQAAPALPPLPAEHRPLQPVAQTVSALAPGGGESAWDDAPVADPATPEEIAQMDWDGLALAIASCRGCGACGGGRAPVAGTGARTARWVVAAGASTAADEKARMPLAGDPGKLLDNMLAAVGMGRERDVYITNLIKCRPTAPTGGERAPTAEEAAACRPFLEREIALTGAAAVLTLGQIAANTLLGRPLQAPLAGTRGSVHALGEAGMVKLVATLHPGELLRRGADKAQAWADLCLARSAAGAAGADRAGNPARAGSGHAG